MKRNKFRNPASKATPKDFLSNADTSSTSSIGEDSTRSPRGRPYAEEVEAPSAELLGNRSNFPWEKFGVLFGLFLAVVAFIWHYASLNANVTNLSEDMKTVKQRGDDLIRTSADNSARLSALEKASVEAAPSNRGATSKQDPK